MLEDALQRGVQFDFVGIDGGYGKEPTFLRSVDGLNCRLVADVHCDQIICLTDPDPKTPVWKGRGKPPTRLQAQCDPIRVDAWAAAQPAAAWQRLDLRDGEPGQLTSEYLHTPVWVWDGAEEPGHYWRLLVRREVGAREVSHYCLSNAPIETPLCELAPIQAQRDFIEHNFREAKTECGMADYQVRCWDAWHHHMALVMLATLFLAKQKILGRQPWPMLSLNDLATALAHLLPRRQLTAEDLAAIIQPSHLLRQKAKDSHAFRTQVALE